MAYYVHTNVLVFYVYKFSTVTVTYSLAEIRARATHIAYHSNEMMTTMKMKFLVVV